MNNATFRATFDKVYEVGDRGYNDGYADGTQKGFTDGYEKCTEDMQDDLKAKYDEGYNNCTEDMQDDLQTKYNEGYESGNQAGLTEGIEQGKEIGYAEGYAAGKAEAGGGSDPYGVEEMLTTLPFLRKVELITTANSMDDYYADWENQNAGFGGAITYQFTDTYEQEPLAIVLPWVTEIQEDTLSNIKCDVKQDGINYATIIFLPKTPPVVGWQGNWSEDGGNYPPSAIFVPDESLEAYKNTPNLTEFAHLIKPLSEYNGEGYHGGKL